MSVIYNTDCLKLTFNVSKEFTVYTEYLLILKKDSMPNYNPILKQSYINVQDLTFFSRNTCTQYTDELLLSDF